MSERGLTRRRWFAAAGLAAATGAPSVLLAQDKPAAALPATDEPPEKPVEFLCPMDPDVREKKPGRCPRCGMKLVAGLPDPIEFRVEMTTSPRRIRAGEPVRLKFRVVHPETGKPVRDFELIHEKLFHLFLLSADLDDFAHEHPVKDFGPDFELEWTFAKPGMYRLMCDYYPLGATPQITVKTLFVDAPRAGAPAPAARPSPPSNTNVDLRLEPAEPIAGLRTRLYFTLRPHEWLVPWLGAWGHVLAASADTIDLIHTHPFLASGGERMQFNVIFPRAGKHRIWIQFDRQGVLNTARFEVSVKTL